MLGRCDISSKICSVMLYWLQVWHQFVEMQPTFQWTLVAIIWNTNGLWAVYIDIWENGWWEWWLVSVLLWTMKSHLNLGRWFISCDVADPICCWVRIYYLTFPGYSNISMIYLIELGMAALNIDDDLSYKWNPWLVSTEYLHVDPDNSIHGFTNHSWDCHADHGKLYG